MRVACLLIYFLIVSCSLSAQRVYYGERTIDTTGHEIFFDRFGKPYPGIFISDTSLARADGSLTSWYTQHPDEFIRLCAEQNYFPEQINLETINRFSQSLLLGFARTVNLSSIGFNAVALYVHGYRKSFKQQNRDVTSTTEFEFLENRLDSLSAKKAFHVRIYWDANYDCCYSGNFKRNKELFQLFEEAYSNAPNVGNSLRNLLLDITHDSIQLVGHSLGARVVMSALFNEIKNSATVQFPNQISISIALIAPATAGYSLFRNYANRNNLPVGSDRYRLQILYNSNDFVLKKKDPKLSLFGPGVKKYGCTELGCDHRNSISKLEKLFRSEFPNSYLELVNCNELGKCHSLRCYTKGRWLDPVSKFFWIEQ